MAGDAPGNLYDDWGGAKARLKQQGVEVDVTYTGESATNVAGGLQRDSTYLGLAEVRLTLDGERFAAWPGATATLDVIRPHGGFPSNMVGDIQGVSNIEAISGGRILEAWLQQNLFEGQVSLLAGRYDLNHEFYQLQSAGLFLNSSIGIGPEFSQTGVAGPSLYPDTAIALRAAARPTSASILRVAVLNGVPVNVARADGSNGIRHSGDGLLYVGEAAVVWPAQPVSTPHIEDRHAVGRRRAGRAAAYAEHDGKVAIGAWHYRSQFDHLTRSEPDGSPAHESGASGFYLIAEDTVYRDSARPQRRLRGFVQFGVGDPDVSRFAQYLGTGLTLSVPFSSRPGDELGIAVARARNGTPYMDAERAQGRAVNHTETAVELTYLTQLYAWLALQPSLQYVINPNTDPRLGDATVVLLRFEISL